MLIVTVLFLLGGLHPLGVAKIAYPSTDTHSGIVFVYIAAVTSLSVPTPSIGGVMSYISFYYGTHVLFFDRRLDKKRSQDRLPWQGRGHLSSLNPWLAPARDQLSPPCTLLTKPQVDPF